MGKISLSLIYLWNLLLDSHQTGTHRYMFWIVPRVHCDLLTLIILSRLKAMLQKLNFPTLHIS